MLNRGVPENAIATILSSISTGTLKQYDSSYRKWWDYCKTNNFNILQFNLSTFMSFIQEQIIDNKLSYSSINIYRSALNLINPPPVSEEKIINRFLKGIYNQRPPKPKYNSTWDPQVVLNYLKSLHPLTSLNMEMLTLKLVMLLALTTGHRSQTISTINIENINISTDFISVKVSDKIKTSGKNKLQPFFKFPFFSEQPELCVASILKFYIEITHPLRNSQEQYLILRHKKLHRKATSQSISRWLKKVLTLSGVDTNIFTGHSTRHASTSAAHRLGVNIDTIRNTAGWSSSSNTFNTFYNLPVHPNQNNFAKAIIGQNK